MVVSAPPRPDRSQPSDVGVRVITAIISVLALAGVIFYATTTDKAAPGGGADVVPGAAPSASSRQAGSGAQPARVTNGAQLRSSFPVPPGASKTLDRTALGADSRIVVYVGPGTEDALVTYYRDMVTRLGVRWQVSPPAYDRKPGGNGYFGPLSADGHQLGTLNVSKLATVYVPTLAPGSVAIELDLDDVSGR